MTLFILAYAAGVLTIVTPCILPILPFVLARVDQSFRRSGLPMLLGLAAAFAMIASLAAFAGGWAVEANRYARATALVSMAIFGLGLLFPAIATRLTAPLVATGSRLAAWAQDGRATVFSAMALGVASGLLWAPCAGPVLGLILSGAALNGPGPQTTTLLFAYGLGAATSLAAALLVGRRILSLARPSFRWIEGARRVTGAAVIVGVVTVGLGIDTSLLTSLSAEHTYRLESALAKVLKQPMDRLGSSAMAATPPTISGPLAALLDKQNWINAAPLRAEDLRGRVVVANFWTYSCINCLRTLPHVRAWAEKYKDQGLVVVGVHAPEFAFEKDLANVTQASASLGVRYPVVLDNDFSIWRAFRNGGWPAIYVVGADGRVRHEATGEGQHDQVEQAIQQLLTEAGEARSGQSVHSVEVRGTQVDADWANLGSPETYVGYAKAERFASPDPLVRDGSGDYRHGSKLPLNAWSLSGKWTVGAEYATLNSAGGGIRYRFHARDVHLILLPPSRDQAIRFRIKIDNGTPGANHGADVDEQGFGVVRDGRLYQLARQSGPVNDRIFEIEFLDPGVRVYAFTFG